MRSFGQTSWKRISTATLASASLFGVLASCARDDSSEQSRNSELSSVSQQSADVEKISFEQWCQRWGLTCPAKPTEFTEDTGESLGESKESLQWQVISQLFDRFMTSGSNFIMEDFELTSAKTRILMTQIGLQTVYGDFLEVLQRSGLRKLVIEPSGKVRFEARLGMNGQAGTVRGKSGMKWTFQNQGSVIVGQGGHYLFDGLLFSAANSLESDVFGRLGYNDTDKTTWSGSNLAVTHVPDGFFIQDVPVRWEKFSEAKRAQVLASVTELRNLLFTSGRSIRVSPAFFDTAARNMSVFVDDAKVLGPVTKLTDAFGTLEVKAPISGSALAQLSLEKASSVMCRIEMSGTPPIEITLDKRFGVQNAYTNERMNAQVDLYGINIKAKVVGFPLSFNLKRVDVEPARIVVKGVPVVGEIVIPLPEEGTKFNKELKKLECNERL